MAIFVDAIQRANQTDQQQPAPAPALLLDMPEHVQSHFANEARPLSEVTLGCCTETEQASCCEPAAKAACCGTEPAQGCGCR